MQQLLHVVIPATVQIPADSLNDSGFSAPGIMRVADVNAFYDASDQLMDAVAPTLSALLPCAPGPSVPEDSCATTTVDTWAPRAYRRPVSSDERQHLIDLYNSQRKAGASFAEAIRVVIEGMLNAPAFLYHWEGASTPLVIEGARVKLDSYEIASRLSFYLTKSAPDDELLAAAASGSLATVDQTASQARRLLKTAGARTALNDFTQQWLGLQSLLSAPKDSVLFPTFDDSVRQAMLDEAAAFSASVVLDGDHLFSTLLTASYSFVNAQLAALYGVKGVTGTTLQRVALDPAQRFGLLTQGAVLAVTANPSEPNPVKRGRLIWEQILCGTISPPPKAFQVPVAPAGQVLTVRQRFEQVHESPGCNACHHLLDPPGFALGNYDAVGGFQTQDQKMPIDASGTLTLPSGKTLTFDGPGTFIKQVAVSDDARTCFAKHWLRYALLRRETDGDASSLDTINKTFAASNFDIQELLVSVATSDAFRYRGLRTGEKAAP